MATNRDFRSVNAGERKSLTYNLGDLHPENRVLQNLFP